MITTVQPTDIQAIVEGNHRDPHHILGPHIVPVRLENKTKQVLVIRAFLPDAEQVTVQPDNKKYAAVPMQKIHPDGFFEALLWNHSEKFPYQFKVTDFWGNCWQQEDPYSQWVDEISDFDQYLFRKSAHYKMYEKLGAHFKTIHGKKGVFFSVWAPNATRVSLVGSFNNWDGRKDMLKAIGASGVWGLFKPGLQGNELYKYEIKTQDGQILLKTDPYACYHEMRPNTASVVYELDHYVWQDNDWLQKRAEQNLLERPLSIYEVHLGSWRRGQDNRFLNYRELAAHLIPYIQEMGFTHIELLPIMEHPFDGSWGYQVTGYFAPTSRFGTPADFQYFVDQCHQNNIGVILDWVPAHFPKDPHGLIEFDGTALYEHQDPRQGEHPDWDTKIFNYGREEVKNFLISNALYWLDRFHIDGLRVDAVASMLYLDYSKKPGEWVPNRYGGRENLEAVEFLKHLNSISHRFFPGTIMIAEESTSWPGVSHPTFTGGLGFTYKWNMGWMHDVLDYMQKNPIHRKFHHNELTFGLMYAWTENFILPFSHDEVVHGKGSLINKMVGDYWQKFANLRLLFSFMFGFPGKQLLFMGQEFGQFSEWNHDQSLDWYLLDFEKHRGLQNCVKDLNHIYQKSSALWEQDFSANGFEGIFCDDYQISAVSFIRRGKSERNFLVFAYNFTPVIRENYPLGVPDKCYYKEIFNSDSEHYGGSNQGNFFGAYAQDREMHGKPYSIQITLPPLACVILQPQFD